MLLRLYSSLYSHSLHALRLIMMVGVISGESAYEMERNLVMESFSCSSAWVASASAVSFIAGGPVGINIMVNQRTGSSPRRLVLEVTRVIMAMLTLP